MHKYTRKSTSQENSAHEKIKACNINYMNSKKNEYFHKFSLLNPPHLHLIYVTVEHVKKVSFCFKREIKWDSRDNPVSGPWADKLKIIWASFFCRTKSECADWFWAQSDQRETLENSITHKAQLHIRLVWLLRWGSVNVILICICSGLLFPCIFMLLEFSNRATRVRLKIASWSTFQA